MDVNIIRFVIVSLLQCKELLELKVFLSWVQTCKTAPEPLLPPGCPWDMAWELELCLHPQPTRKGQSWGCCAGGRTGIWGPPAQGAAVGAVPVWVHRGEKGITGLPASHGRGVKSFRTLQ